MKKKLLWRAVYVLAFAVTLVNVIFSLKNYLFADINDLPRGKCVSSVSSPDGYRTVDVYVVKNSLGTAVRGELTFTETGEHKNIFWQTGISKVYVHWEGDEVVYFNEVPVSGNGANSYDCRRGTSLFTDGALEDERLRNR